jgi:transcriptional regulator with XRE-family HTH domain
MNPWDLRAERIRRGLTRPQLAREIGVKYKTLQRAEHGTPIREDSAKLIADYFGVDPIVFVEPPERAAAA